MLEFIDHKFISVVTINIPNLKNLSLNAIFQHLEPADLASKLAFCNHLIRLEKPDIFDELIVAMKDLLSDSSQDNAMAIITWSQALIATNDPNVLMKLSEFELQMTQLFLLGLYIIFGFKSIR